MKLNPGDITMIYDDAPCRTKPVGNARLLKRYKKNDILDEEWWAVHFVDDPDPESVENRWIFTGKIHSRRKV